MAEETIELLPIASQSLSFSPLPRPAPGATRWVIYSRDRSQAVVLNSDFDLVRHFDFSAQQGVTSVSADGTIAVCLRSPDIIVQIGDRQQRFANPGGDTGFGSAALVLEDACYFVQPPAELTENYEIDDYSLVKLDFTSGDISPIAPIPTEGHFVVLDAGTDLAVVAHDGQHGSTTAGISRTTNEPILTAELAVATEHHWLARGGEMFVTLLGVDQFAADHTWFVSSSFDGLTVATWPSWEIKGAWQPVDQEQPLYPMILRDDRIVVWEVDTEHLTVLDPSDLSDPIGRIDLPAGHHVANALEDRLVTVRGTTAHLWSLET